MITSSKHYHHTTWKSKLRDKFIFVLLRKINLYKKERKDNGPFSQNYGSVGQMNVLLLRPMSPVRLLGACAQWTGTDTNGVVIKGARIKVILRDDVGHDREVKNKRRNTQKGGLRNACKDKERYV